MDTGQHYDYKLNEVFYEQLGVRPPQHFLEVGSAAHAVQTSAVLTRAAAVFESARPRMVVVIGDTNSTLGCALAAAQMRIPMVHVEAGCAPRTERMAEEINRRMVDAVADLLCAPSASAAHDSQLEHQSGTIEFTGDIAHDVLQRNLGNARAPEARRQAACRRHQVRDRDAASGRAHGESGSVVRRLVASLRRFPFPSCSRRISACERGDRQARARNRRYAARRAPPRLLRDDRRDPATRAWWSPTREVSSERHTGSACRA